jgi:hypothetical protein
VKETSSTAVNPPYLLVRASTVIKHGSRAPDEPSTHQGRGWFDPRPDPGPRLGDDPEKTLGGVEVSTPVVGTTCREVLVAGPEADCL